MITHLLSSTALGLVDRRDFLTAVEEFCVVANMLCRHSSLGDERLLCSKYVRYLLFVIDNFR